MHVIAGKAKGRKLLAVPGDSTRPILNRVKTALFDTIRPYIEDVQFLDLFGGTGAIGIEALSQGAKHCIFTELNHKACETIKKNLENTQLLNQAQVIKTDAFTYLKKSDKTFDIIYVAPPQYKGLWIQALHEIDTRPELITEDGQVIIQIDPREYKEQELKNFTEYRRKEYGNTLILFYEKK